MIRGNHHRSLKADRPFEIPSITNTTVFYLIADVHAVLKGITPPLYIEQSKITVSYPPRQWEVDQLDRYRGSISRCGWGVGVGSLTPFLWKHSKTI